MTRHILNFRLLIILPLFAASYLSFAFPAGAQTAPQFLVSWQAQDYVPVWYSGKIFPVNGTRINVRFELLDRGKPVNLMAQNCESVDGSVSQPCRVRWYVGDNMVANEDSGLGIKTISFVNNSVYSGDSVSVRISIPYYHGQSADQTFDIPVKSQEAVIDAHYYQNQIDKKPSAFRVWPFFFNSVNGFSFSWLMDGQVVDGSAQLINLNIDPGTASQTQINLGAQIQNSVGEAANSKIQLRVK